MPIFTTFIHCFTRGLDSEMKEKEVTDTISTKTQNMRESTYKPVKLVRMISHEPVTSQMGSVIKKKLFHNKRRAQK